MKRKEKLETGGGKYGTETSKQQYQSGQYL